MTLAFTPEGVWGARAPFSVDLLAGEDAALEDIAGRHRRATERGEVLTPFNLEKAAALLAPPETPLRNRTKRCKVGGRVVASTFLAHPGAHPEEEFVAPRIQALGARRPTEEESRGSAVDVEALLVANVLRAVMIKEEEALLFANPDPAIDYPTLVTHPGAYRGLLASLLHHRDSAHIIESSGDLSRDIDLLAWAMERDNGEAPDLILMNPKRAISLWNGSRASAVFSKRSGSRIDVNVHPRLDDRDVLLITTKIPSRVAEFIADLRLQEEIPAPWSVANVYDYLELRYTPDPERVDDPGSIEIRQMGALRLHLPFLFGWIRG